MNKNSVKVLGYSERGLINSLVYELSAQGADLVRHFLSQIFLLKENRFLMLPEIEEVTFLVDQSLSDFGDADLLVLVKTPKEKITIFVEAKVKTCQEKKWSLDDEYQRFLRGIESKNVSSSNLFAQMYHKYLLFEHLKKYGLARLKDGVEAQGFFKKKVKKIGNNEVVLRAAKLIEEHADRAYYIMLVPTISAEARSVGRALIREDNIFKKINTLGYVTGTKF